MTDEPAEKDREFWMKARSLMLSTEAAELAFCINTDRDMYNKEAEQHLGNVEKHLKALKEMKEAKEEVLCDEE